MISNLISPSALSSQVTVNGSHCIGVEILNLIAWTPLVRVARTVKRVEARRKEVGRGMLGDGDDVWSCKFRLSLVIQANCSC